MDNFYDKFIKWAIVVVLFGILFECCNIRCDLEKLQPTECDACDAIDAE